MLVPQGLWHTAEVAAPSRMLFITRGQGHRAPAGDERHLSRCAFQSTLYIYLTTAVRHTFAIAALLAGCCLSLPAAAQVPVTAAPDHAALLASPTPSSPPTSASFTTSGARSSEAGHLELADKYMAETYIQHNPMVPTGPRGLRRVLWRFPKKPGPIALGKVAAPW